MKLDMEKSVYLSYLLGMWHHTRHLCGLPPITEIKMMLCDWPKPVRIDAQIFLMGAGMML